RFPIDRRCQYLVEKNDGLIATEVRTIATLAPGPRICGPNGNETNIIFAGTYGIGMFRSFDSGQSWEQINNGLSARYDTCLATNSRDMFVGADFVGGAGGVFRSTDFGES